MTLLRCLRALRPHLAAPRLPATTGRASLATRARPARGADGKGEHGVDGTEFKRQRSQRLAALEELGAEDIFTEAYPRLKPKHNRRSISSFKSKYQSQSEEAGAAALEKETLYGRVESIRQHGNKLIFLTMKNGLGSIQGMINQRKIEPRITVENFKMFARLIERGDHIGITGVPTRTNSGELVIEASEVPQLLSPTMEPVPETLIDPETKSQKRHLDMLINPEVADTLRLKSYIMRYMRDHFQQDDFLEVQTPILAHNAGGAVARPFTTHATEFPSKELSLRVAPELWLKRLVIGGMNKVFEIGPAFRNEGIDATHNPEFTMCEFYAAYTNLDDLIANTERLLSGLAKYINEVITSKELALNTVDDARFDNIERVEFLPALEAALGFSLPNLTGPDVVPELIALFKLQGVTMPGDGYPASLPKLLDRLAAVYLEPRSFDNPIFITHHPACMSPLAKSFVCPKTRQLVSARAELFVDGRELANMYEEENDPKRQAQKLASYRALSTRGRSSHVPEAAGEAQGEEAAAEAQSAAEEEDMEDEPFEDEDGDAAPLDKSYIRAMEAGLPPTGGWGCGVERLVMLFSGANRISDCLTFGTLRNVVGLTASASEQGSKAQKTEKTEGDDGSKA